MARTDDQDWIDRFEGEGEELVQRNFDRGYYGHGTRHQLVARGWLRDKKAARLEPEDPVHAPVLLGGPFESSPSRMERLKRLLAKFRRWH